MMGTAAAIAGAAGPTMDYGQDGGADGLSQNTQWQADYTTTHATSQKRADASVLCTGLGARGPGRFTIQAKVFLSDNQRIDV